jgi:hypothetical protein
MGEYAPLVKRLGGEVIEISPDSPHHINPMDIDMESEDDENPLALKADFLLSLCELVVGGKDGLQPIERTVIDRCTRLVYKDIILNPDTAEMPTLQNLYELLNEQPEPEARRLATALEIYCTGSLNVFNYQTNVLCYKGCEWKHLKNTAVTAFGANWLTNRQREIVLQSEQTTIIYVVISCRAIFLKNILKKVPKYPLYFSY